MYHLGIDIGGTFTDVLLADVATGRQVSLKTPTTPANPARGFVNGLRAALEAAGGGPDDLARIFHGTTVATNAILENRDEVVIGMLTTKGFRHVLEIGRHDVPDGESYYGWLKPARPVPPDLIMEVEERVGPDGNVLTELNEEDVRRAARTLRERGVQAVAVSFLYAYLRPEHEVRAAEIVREEFPGVLLAVSSDVLPAFREYERSIATALSARVMPSVSTYLALLEEQLQSEAPTARLYVMKSNGGLTSAETAANQALSLALSGPAAGVVGASAVAAAAGFQNVITLDVGGTSSDIALIAGGDPVMTVNQTIGSFPVSIPMVDIHAVGAGGGSIARVTSTGLVQVGPQSAGADPGPVCYGKGGVEPTVTDAQVALGRLPVVLAKGAITLDRDAAQGAVKELASGLDMPWEEAGEGVLRIAIQTMARGIRTISVERGYDPAEFVLLGFGGAGPLLAADLAEELGMSQVLVPPRPGVLSAWGLLQTDLKSDYVRTVTGGDPETVAKALDEMTAEAQHWLAEEGISPEEALFARAFDCRYPKQGVEISVPCPDGPVTEETLEAVREAFHREHHRLNTFDMRHMPVEIVNVRLTVSKQFPRPPQTETDGGAPAEQAVARETRPVFFGGWMDTPVYDRARLLPGGRVEGPAIIEQEDTTTVVPPGWTARVDGLGNIIMKAGDGR